MAAGTPRGSPPTSVTPAASMATSAPLPIAIPTSARASAGASLIPSPTIATTWPSAWTATVGGPIGRLLGHDRDSPLGEQPGRSDEHRPPVDRRPDSVAGDRDELGHRSEAQLVLARPCDDRRAERVFAAGLDRGRKVEDL